MGGCSQRSPEVISSEQYTFVNDYQNLWDIEQESLAQTEHIFSVPFFRDKDALADQSLGSNIAHLFNPAGVQVGGKLVSGNPYGKGAGAHRVQKWFIKYFQDDQGNLGYSDPSVDASIDESNSFLKITGLRLHSGDVFQQRTIIQEYWAIS